MLHTLPFSHVQFGVSKQPTAFQLAILRSREPLRQALEAKGMQVMVSFSPPKAEQADTLTIKAFSDAQAQLFTDQLNALSESESVPGLKQGPKGQWTYQASPDQPAVPLKIQRMPNGAK